MSDDIELEYGDENLGRKPRQQSFPARKSLLLLIFSAISVVWMGILPAMGLMCLFDLHE